MYLKPSFFVLLIFAIGCTPEQVPIVATYEPVDCSCPTTLDDAVDDGVAVEQVAEPESADGVDRVGTSEDRADSSPSRHDAPDREAGSDAGSKTSSEAGSETSDEAKKVSEPGHSKTSNHDRAPRSAGAGRSDKPANVRQPAEKVPAAPDESPAPDSRVDLNFASLAELQTLPRIGPSKAQRILEYRQKRPFRRTSDLMRIKGIGPATFRKLKDKIVVGEKKPSDKSDTSRELR